MNTQDSRYLLDQASQEIIDQTVQLIRSLKSKGVALFFVASWSFDLPESVVSQLSSRFLHGLHAYSLEEMESLKQCTTSLTPNPEFDAISEVQRLGVGQALVSTLNSKGKTLMVEKVTLLPCHSSLTPLSKKAVSEIVAQDTFAKKYEKSQDERSAYEILKESNSLKTSTKSEKKSQSSTSKATSKSNSVSKSKSTSSSSTTTSKSTDAGEFVGAFASQPTSQVIKPQNNKVPDSIKEQQSQEAKKSTSSKKNSTSTKKSSSSSASKAQKSPEKGKEAVSLEKVMKDSVKTIGRQGAQAITRSLLGGKSNEVSKQVENIAGNLVSNLLDSLWK